MRKIPVSALLATASLTLVVSACGGSSSESQPSPSAAGSSAPAASSSASGGASSSATASSSASSNNSASSKDIVANPPKKSWQDAVDAAQKEFQGKVDKIELETQEGGGYEYKIEQLSSTEKYAVQYDADTLKKLSQKRDSLGDDAKKDQKETFDPGSLISLDKAADTARQQQDGTINKWKIEGKDDGRVQYEFDITPPGGGEDKEIQINAKDGSVIKGS